VTRPPRWCRPRVDDIYAAPELAVLAVLEAAVDVALVAVAAAYPDDDEDDMPPVRRAADLLVDAGRELHAAINRYRLALVVARQRDRLLPF
jgi:hypothetical protein